jgi:hypothetical protein
VKLVQIQYHFEFTDSIEDILENHDIRNFVRYSMVESKDRDGKHYGSKVYPGRSCAVQVLADEEIVDPLLRDLLDFKEAEDSHRHLTALVLPLETVLT